MNKHKRDIKLLILDVDGTMTDAGVYIMEDGKQFKKFNARDGMGIKLAMKAGIEVGIISHSSVREMVEARAHMLGLHYCYIGTESKLEIFRAWMTKLKLDREQVAFIGDDVNDLDIIEAVGFTACPADAVDEIKRVVDVQLTLKGGEGCVREFIDQYLMD